MFNKKKTSLWPNNRGLQLSKFSTNSSIIYSITQNKNKSTKYSLKKFFNVDKETEFFIDIDRKKTIVRKRKNLFELEVISKENPQWIKTTKDSSYEREYYFGGGNACLFNISFNVVLNKFKEWEIPLKLLDEK